MTSRVSGGIPSNFQQTSWSCSVPCFWSHIHALCFLLFITRLSLVHKLTREKNRAVSLRINEIFGLNFAKVCNKYGFRSTKYLKRFHEVGAKLKGIPPVANFVSYDIVLCAIYIFLWCKIQYNLGTALPVLLLYVFCRTDDHLITVLRVRDVHFMMVPQNLNFFL